MALFGLFKGKGSDEADKTAAEKDRLEHIDAEEKAENANLDTYAQIKADAVSALKSALSSTRMFIDGREDVLESTMVTSSIYKTDDGYETGEVKITALDMCKGFETILGDCLSKVRDTPTPKAVEADSADLFGKFSTVLKDYQKHLEDCNYRVAETDLAYILELTAVVFEPCSTNDNGAEKARIRRQLEVLDAHRRATAVLVVYENDLEYFKLALAKAKITYNEKFDEYNKLKEEDDNFAAAIAMIDGFTGRQVVATFQAKSEQFKVFVIQYNLISLSNSVNARELNVNSQEGKLAALKGTMQNLGSVYQMLKQPDTTALMSTLRGINETYNKIVTGEIHDLMENFSEMEHYNNGLKAIFDSKKVEITIDEANAKVKELERERLLIERNHELARAKREEEKMLKEKEKAAPFLAAAPLDEEKAEARKQVIEYKEQLKALNEEVEKIKAEAAESEEAICENDIPTKAGGNNNKKNTNRAHGNPQPA